MKSEKKTSSGKCRSIAFAIIALILTLYGCGGNEISSPAASKGVIDLRSWDFRGKGPVSLNGEWEFYWNRLYTPDDFKVPRPPLPMSCWEFPAYGTEPSLMTKTLGGRGFATYRLLIRIDNQGSALGLKILDAATAYRLWINGQLLASNGTVGDSPEAGKPQYLPMVVPIPDNLYRSDAGEAVLEMIVQVSNFNHTKGGLWESIRIGLHRELVNSRELNIALAFFLAGVIIIMGLYHLGLYLLRRKEIATFFFASPGPDDEHSFPDHQ